MGLRRNPYAFTELGVTKKVHAYAWTKNHKNKFHLQLLCLSLQK